MTSSLDLSHVLVPLPLLIRMHSTSGGPEALIRPW